MDIIDNALILLKKVLMETENGFRLRTTTREEIKRQVSAMEKDKNFMTELIPQKGD